MKKQEKIDENVISLEALVHPHRLSVSTPHFVLDDHIETVQDQAYSVQQLYSDFVLGKLDPRQLAGSPVYDDENAQEVDPFNHFGVTFEETSQVADRGTSAVMEIRKKHNEVAEKQRLEAEAKQREKLEAEIRASIQEEEAAKNMK